ncbi:response regulator transcription factor [Chloracidobacterium aggregatum]|jgi:CheY-like chemotaxis protein|uniref:Response regulator transcription factor n=1 Tax=Chloracidobacterium sp. N TaxID=2821540 RepID=A0ABX8B548_9BACT|nr:response regulator transcription factor [Chloracidobacterium aggregatum]QUV94201.1 response regulator transcription factor [Chloracidobacterium sp. N]QUV97400.1 response regulator transcription factor [Chloracidobacterium sp. E]
MAHILVIDDEPDVRLATVMALKHGGHTTVEADGGLPAMRLLQQQGPFDLIVCDVMMPGMTGHEVCQLVRLNQATKNIPFIFLSAKRDTDERLEGIGLGADDYLGKPFALEELLIRVNSVLARHQAMVAGRATPDPLQQVTLAQCIDLVVRHKLSGKLNVLIKSDLGDKAPLSGAIFFEGGHAVHAKLEDRLGETAVREILASPLLMYSFEAYEVADQITMAMDITRLIKRHG